MRAYEWIQFKSVIDHIMAANNEPARKRPRKSSKISSEDESTSEDESEDESGTSEDESEDKGIYIYLYI